VSVALQFIGAARTVTGSRHLLRTEHGSILLDCGLYQGRRAESRQRNLDLGVHPPSIDAVILSHAHIDHSGALPILCKRGFGGPIYATAATRDLCAYMLEDAAMIQAADARYLNRAIEREHVDADPIEPLYDRDDVARALSQFVIVPYDRPKVIVPGITARLLDAGHVLGSAITVLDVDDDQTTKRIAFTGDLGRAGTPILRDPELPEGVSTLIIESTYGDRLHPPIAETDAQLAAIVRRTAERGGKVLIPSFALERAQQLIFSLKKLRATGAVPPIPVYVDSPLTVNVTSVFRAHPECYDQEAARWLAGNDSPFDFEGLHFIDSVQDSMAIDASPDPSIIISASGMCEAGRILHHLKAHVENARNAVVIVGFQAQHTLGRRIVERRPQLRIFGVDRRLHAEVAVLNGFSAHADQAGLLRFIERVRGSGTLSRVALVHGEITALESLREKLAERAVPGVAIPAPGDIWRF
jgi:metallo-beta-lactamase family protein